jgi:hypothetical protein
MTTDKPPQDTDSALPQESDEVGENVSKNLSKKILQNINKSYTGEETSKFIVHLGETLQPPASEEHTPNPEGDREFRFPAPSLLDKLFDDFVRYSFEFAKTPIGSELPVECLRPRPPRDPAQLAPGQTPVIVEGTLMVGGWTMLVQAQERRIRAFVIPRDYLAGFHARQAFYSPFMEMEAIVNGTHFIWQLDDQQLTVEVLPRFSKQLFSALVKVSAGEASHTERFRFESSNSQSISGLLPKQSEKLALHNLSIPGALAADNEAGRILPDNTRKGSEPDAAEELQANKLAVLSMFESLMRSLDNELNRLHRIEREACRVADMKTIEQTALRSKQLRALLDRITVLAGDWRTLSSTDRRSEN